MARLSPTLSEVVRTLELSEIPVGDDACEPLKYRIEVLKEPSDVSARYFARVTRWETYRMVPRFIGMGKEVGEVEADSELMIVDDEFSGLEISGRTEDDVIDGVIEYMRSRGYIA